MYQKGYNYYNNHQYTEAVEWFRKAAEQGHAEGQFRLGLDYYYGSGVAEDQSKAVYWFRKSAEQGFLSAEYQLGECYENGQGVAQDKSMALYWYRKAAAKFHSHAKEKVQQLESQGYR